MEEKKCDNDNSWKVGRSEWIRFVMQSMLGELFKLSPKQEDGADIINMISRSELDGGNQDTGEWKKWLSALDTKIAQLEEDKSNSLFPDMIEDEIRYLTDTANVLREWIEQVRKVDEEERRQRRERNKKYAKNKQRKRKEDSLSLLIPITKSYLESTLNLQTATDVESMKHDLPMEDKVSVRLANGSNFGERIVTREYMEKSLDVLKPIVGERRFDIADKEYIDVDMGKEDLRRYIGMTYAPSTIITDEILDKIVSGLLFWNAKYVVWRRPKKISLAPLLTIKYDADVVDGYAINDKLTLHIYLPPFTGINKDGYVLDKSMTKPLTHLVDGDSVVQRVKTIIATTQSHMSESSLFESAYRLSEKNPESVRKNMSRTRQQMDRIFKRLKKEDIILSYRRYKNKDGECVWEWTKKSVKN